jgi:hypothetical protein
MKIYHLPDAPKSLVFDIDLTLYDSRAYHTSQRQLLIECLAASLGTSVQETEATLRTVRDAFARHHAVVYGQRAANSDWLKIRYDQPLNHLSGGPDDAIRSDSYSHRGRRPHAVGRFVAPALSPWQEHTHSHETAKSHTRSQAVCRLHPQARVSHM